MEAGTLPADLAVLDRLLADPRLLAPIEHAWGQATRGRPSDDPDGQRRVAPLTISRSRS